MNNLFDKVYCLNLVRCTDRREHMIKEFEKIGITKYQFFEATDKDSPEVKHAFKSGFVNNSYRPLNPLSRSEVGNFLSFRRIFKDIIRNNIKFALICEDDLNFMPYTQTVLSAVFSPHGMKKYGFNLHEPTLIRLGWKKCSDHHYNGHVRVQPYVIISNPCFAINLEMAKKLDSNLHQINTPSDVYIHRILSPHYNHHTVFPPIAHDLTRSSNPKFRSEIRPDKGARHLPPPLHQPTPQPIPQPSSQPEPDQKKHPKPKPKYIRLSALHMRKKYVT